MTERERGTLEREIEWRAVILNKAPRLRKSIWKAVVSSSLHEDPDDFDKVATRFRLAQKYVCTIWSAKTGP